MSAATARSRTRTHHRPGEGAPRKGNAQEGHFPSRLEVT